MSDHDQAKWCPQGAQRQFLSRLTRAANPEYRSPAAFQLSPGVSRNARDVCDRPCSWWLITVQPLSKIRLVQAGDGNEILPLTRNQIVQWIDPVTTINGVTTLNFSNPLHATTLKAQLTLSDGSGSDPFIRRVDIGRGFALWWYGASANVEIGHGPPADVPGVIQPLTKDATQNPNQGFIVIGADVYEDTIVECNVRPAYAPPPSHAQTPLLWSYTTFDGAETTGTFHFAPPGARRASVYMDAPNPAGVTARWVLHPAPIINTALPPLTRITGPIGPDIPLALSQPVPGPAYGINVIAAGQSTSVWEIEL